MSMKRTIFVSAALVLLAVSDRLTAQTVQVSVDAAQDRIAVSPNIYGRNGGLPHDSHQPLSEAE